MDRLLGLNARQARAAAPFALSLGAIALLTAILAPLHARLALLNVGLLYLVLVVLVTARFGLWTGVSSSLLVNLALNFFFVPPVHRLSVNESENLIALVVFLGVTLLTSALLARAERGEQAAREREKEAALMFDLSQGVISDPGAQTVLPLLCAKVRQAFSTESAAIFRVVGDRFNLAAGDGVPLHMELTGDERVLAISALESGKCVFVGGRPGSTGPRVVGRPSVAKPAVMVPLVVAGERFGVLRVSGGLHADIEGADEMRLLQVFADVAAMAINHQRLLHELTASRALQEADVLKSALLSTVSHELRTPLASIKASVTSLLEGTADWDEPTRREFLSAIDEDTDRLTALISNLLDLSRLEGGAITLKRDWYDVRELLGTVCDRFLPRWHGAALTVDLDEAVGEAFVDYVLIGQVIQNLVENALKFSPREGRVRIIARGLDGGLEIRVEDEGPGIAEEERERVFEKFYRGRDVRGRITGTGLGLAIARGLVAAHGGTIRAEAAPNGGAALVVWIPPTAYRQQPMLRPQGRVS